MKTGKTLKGKQMNKTIELEKAARQALEAMENAEDQLAKPYSTQTQYAITALRQALSESVEQPAKTLDLNDSFEREEAAQARVREFMRNH